MKDRQFWIVLGSLFVVFLIYWYLGHHMFNVNRVVMFISIVVISATLLYNIRMAERGEEFYLRPIPGLKAVEEQWVDLLKWVNLFYMFRELWTWIK